MRLPFKSVASEQSRLPSIMWVGLIQSGEGPEEKKTIVPQGGKNSASGLELQLLSGPPASRLTPQILHVQLHNRGSQLLNLHPPPHTRINAHVNGSVSLKNPDCTR